MVFPAMDSMSHDTARIGRARDLAYPAAGISRMTPADLGRRVLAFLQAALDRSASIGYGVVYDFVFQRFAPYRKLQAEVVAMLQHAAPEPEKRRDIRVLDIGCGPGSFAFAVAEAGFSVVGVDAYSSLLDIAREKRQAERLPNLSFRHADLARGDAFAPETFDQVLNVHSLYVHPAPDELLRQAHRVLKPGGHGVFVNFTRRIALWPTFRAVAAREGLAMALRSLLWVAPNAVFELTRKRVGPHYWQEDEFATRLRNAGFAVLELRRTFFDQASLLAWVRKESGGNGR
jgi:ubiquinone/menaquinone biosynthesis C-methylase UbiE